MVQWEPGSHASDVAECATQEVECTNGSEPGASPKPVTCPGRATECAISGLMPGCQYQVDLPLPLQYQAVCAKVGRAYRDFVLELQ